MGTSDEPSPTECELAELRQRACGPAADIAGDPTALAPLDELQNRQLPPLQPTPEAVVDAPMATPPTRSEAATSPLAAARISPHKRSHRIRRLLPPRSAQAPTRGGNAS